LGPHSYPERVIITYPSYPPALSDILNRTSSDVLEAYLLMRATLTLAPYLGHDTETWKAVRSLEEALKGIKKGAVGDRAEFCVARVEEALGFAAGRYFVNETFGSDSREKGVKVITGK
jgi:endothelin-converting enzyme